MSPLKIIAVIVAALGAGLGAWQASGSVVTGVIAALAPVALALPSPVYKPKAGALLVFLLPLAACSNLAPGYRALVVVKKAGDKTGQTIAAVCKAKRIQCQAKHKDDKPALMACITPCHEALKVWVQKVKPAVNAAQKAAWASLEVAFAAKKHKADWLAMLKPAVCGLLGVLASAAKIPELSKALGPAIDPIKAIEGMVCK